MKQEIQKKLKASLQKLDSSKQSIETVSNWLKFYKHDFKAIVSIWYEEFCAANAERRLALVYLCNDIIQNNRKDGMNLIGEFYEYLPRVVTQITKGGNTKIHQSVSRLLKIWHQRRIFGSKGIPLLLQQTQFALDGVLEGPTSTTTSPEVKGKGKETTADSSEIKEIRGLSAQIGRTEDEIRRIEMQNKESLSTSAIMSGSSDQKMLKKYQTKIWDCIQNQRTLLSALESWKKKIEESISDKENSVKQIKKDLLARKDKMASESSSKVEEESASALIAQKLFSSQNAAELLKNALKTMSNQDKLKISAQIQQQENNTHSHSPSEQAAKRARMG